MRTIAGRLALISILPLMFAVMLAVNLFATSSGCGGKLGAAASAMTGSFEACAKADLGKLVTVGNLTGPAETVVGQLIAGNAPGLEADLVVVAGVVGVDGLDCAKAAVAAAWAALTAPASSTDAGTGSASTAPRTSAELLVDKNVTQGLERAQVLIDSLRTQGSARKASK